MSSKKPSDTSYLDRLEEDLPTTAEDVEALRRARRRQSGEIPFSELLHLLRAPDWVPQPRRPKFQEEYERFEL